MAGWDDGYVTDVAYTTNFYREITPVWLASTCLLLGQRPPDLTRPFRYADLGCGNGFTAVVVAAAHPEAEVWGFDFNPAHVEWASRIASLAGLTNIRFVETSFADLAARPEGGLPDFDFMVTHGVLSWISPENRAQLVQVVRQRLRPGGLLYASYNVTTGWPGMVALRTLMRLLAENNATRTDLAAAGIMEFIDKVKAAGALFFPANPSLENRIADIKRQDPRYIAHEYLNRDWHLLMFADVQAELAEAKCSYIGSATLTDNIDSIAVPGSVAPLLSETAQPVLRETLRDFGSAQAFRRDLYRRGQAAMTVAEQQSWLDDLSILSLGQTVADPVTFTTPLGTVTGRNEIYQPLFELLNAGPLTVHQARQVAPFTSRPLVELLQAITLMIAGGYAHPTSPTMSQAARQSTQKLNAAIAAANGLGGDLNRLAAPAIGSAMQMDLLETLLIGEHLAGRPTDAAALSTAVLALLARSGRSMQRDGKPVADPAEAQTMVTDLVQRFLAQRLPLFRSLGILE